MKTVKKLTKSAFFCRQRVKKLLIVGIIHLTSEKFFIFVGAIATLICWTGVVLDKDLITASGGIVFLVGFTPWSFRITAREIRQNKD